MFGDGSSSKSPCSARLCIDDPALSRQHPLQRQNAGSFSLFHFHQAPNRVGLRTEAEVE